jgi:hypothetical protein
VDIDNTVCIPHANDSMFILQFKTPGSGKR